MRNLADLDAVEKDVSAVRKAGNRAVENDLESPVAARRRIARDPHHKQKRAHDGRQGKGADHDIVGPRLHSAQRPAFRDRSSPAVMAGRSAAESRITPLLPWK